MYTITGPGLIESDRMIQYQRKTFYLSGRKLLATLSSQQQNYRS